MVFARSKKQSIYIQFLNKHFLKLFFLLFVFFSIFLLVTRLKNVVYFPINEVKVFGAQHTDHVEIQHLITPLVNEGFFAVDAAEIKDRLLLSPWVSRVVVQRIWPKSVLVKIIEKQPIARWSQGDLLSDQGELFHPVESTTALDLPSFIGPEGQQMRMLDYYKKMSTLLAPLHFKISKLELMPHFSWKATFDNGIKLMVGRKEFLPRFDRFVRLYPKMIGDRATEVEYIDLRYANGIAIKWKK